MKVQVYLNGTFDKFLQGNDKFLQGNIPISKAPSATFKIKKSFVYVLTGDQNFREIIFTKIFVKLISPKFS